MKKFLGRISRFTNSERGEAAIKGVRQCLPMLLFVLFGLVATHPAFATSAGSATTVATSINGGFTAIFDLGKKIVGGLALAMALWWGFKWISGDPESMKKAIGTGIAGIAVMNLDGILKLFGLTF